MDKTGDFDHDQLIELIARFDEYRQAVELRLHKLNELREQVEADRAQYLRLDVYNEKRELFELRISAMERRWAWGMGAAAVLVVFSTIIGAVIERLLWGH